MSNLGRVKSSYGKGKILTPRLNSDGYPRVELYKRSKSKSHYIHRLVATAFIPNPNSFQEINHKDENKSNNIVSNLEWCSHEYNLTYNRNINIESMDYLSFKTVFLDIVWFLR